MTASGSTASESIDGVTSVAENACGKSLTTSVAPSPGAPSDPATPPSPPETTVLPAAPPPVPVTPPLPQAAVSPGAWQNPSTPQVAPPGHWSRHLTVQATKVGS